MTINRDDVIRLACEAGFLTGVMHDAAGAPVWPLVQPAGNGCIVELERFAALVAATEREACAVVCDPQPGIRYSPNSQSARQQCAAAIRTRGQAPAQTCCKGGPQWGHALDCKELP